MITQHRQPVDSWRLVILQELSAQEMSFNWKTAALRAMLSKVRAYGCRAQIASCRAHRLLQGALVHLSNENGD